MLDIRYPDGAKNDAEKIASMVTNLSKLDDAIKLYIMRYYCERMPRERHNSFYENFVKGLTFMSGARIAKKILYDSERFPEILEDFVKNAQRLAEIRNVIGHETKFILDDDAYQMSSIDDIWPNDAKEEYFQQLDDRDKPISMLYDEFVSKLSYFDEFIKTIYGEDAFYE